ncbi:acyl-CoA N-acyltransferase [Nitzschia inconspicua]|uniref:Acyl-CoA N-acyltransferase n=1 Tax=Nitzschia inconspicua TaxID=303405 RepID=A0A9K3KUJ2_9STRA|nr:acyl-CoA N-acyltransferase [Nitzschia inconspicua]
MGRRLPVELGRITQDNVEQLRKINLACFPVQYQETYYKDVVTHDEGLCKFAYWDGFVVGAACARIEPLPDDSENQKQNHENASSSNSNNNGNGNKKQKNAESGTKKRIYIMTLGVLAAFRDREIGTQLIQSIFDHYEANKDSGEYKDVVEIVLHVQISNAAAIKFYTTRFGFEQGEMVENYYRRIDPPHCYKLFKKLA